MGNVQAQGSEKLHGKAFVIDLCESNRKIDEYRWNPLLMLCEGGWVDE